MLRFGLVSGHDFKSGRKGWKENWASAGFSLAKAPVRKRPAGNNAGAKAQILLDFYGPAKVVP
jgi:hypothetical protein